MTVVVGTAGHIDHGKTTLLRALTGIDADRLPEERRRGMTIDVGYAHLTLEDGTAIDFVDVPGHDKLVGNMLVGAGEVDAALLVVAADDGPRAQTLEHLALLDVLGLRQAIVVITKIDAVEADRVAAVRDAVDGLLASTSLAGSPVLTASGVTGQGIGELRSALTGLRDRVPAIDRPPTLAIDRVFSVKGRGAVVTGTLRGGPLVRGASLRLVPGDRVLRIREIQVHGEPVAKVERGGRTALNLAGIGADELHRGQVLTADPAVRAADRIVATFAAPVADRTRARIHAGTAAADGAIGRSGRDAMTLPDGSLAGIVRLSAPLALRPGDRFVLRRGSTLAPIGGIVLDVDPARGVSRRRQSAERLARLAAAIEAADGPAAISARLELHGALATDGHVVLAPDVEATAAAEAEAQVAHAPETPLATLRTTVARSLRRAVSLRREAAGTAAAGVVEALVTSGRLARDGDTVRRPGASGPAGESGPAGTTGSTRAASDPALAAAMDRLEAALAVVAPPPLDEAAHAAACSTVGIRELQRGGRIVMLGPDLAYAAATYRDLAARALSMATRAPLTPAAFRDATGTSRKYVMAILEDLDRRLILRRTPDGHVPGPKAPRQAEPAR